MTPPNKIFLTSEQETYLVNNYETVINHTLCKHLGISPRTLTRLSRERGLVKDLAAIEGQRLERLSKSLRMTFLLRGGNNHSENGLRTQFKPGFKPRELFGEEKFRNMHRKAVETRKARFAEERARVSFGLPQRTNMRVKKQPRQKILDRAYLKRRGYVLDEANNIAYYTDETRRATRMEAMPRRFYIFKPYEDQHQ